MQLRRAAALACTALSLAASAASSQTKPADVGLLVGLSSGRTLWIAPQDGQMRLISTKYDFLVRRPGAFWWVGTAQRCEVEELDGSGMNISEAGAFLARNEEVFVTRAGDTAHATLDGIECDIAEQQVVEKRAASARAEADSLARAGDSTALKALANESTAPGGVDSIAARLEDATLLESMDCSLNTREITFVSSSVISVEERETTTEFCAPAKYSTSGRNVVTTFGSAAQLELRPLLPPAQRARIAREFSSSGVCGFEEDMSEDHVDDAWAIRRVEGKWRAVFFVDGPLACRGGTDLDLSPALPSSFTGDPPLPIAWAELNRKIPRLWDAAAHPAGTHLALISDDTLSIVRVRGGQLGETLIKVPLGWSEHFVMLRWAKPAEIVEWNRVIPTLREPTVVVTATSPAEQ